MLLITKVYKHHNAHDSKIKHTSSIMHTIKQVILRISLETPACQVPFIVTTAHKMKIEKPYMLDSVLCSYGTQALYYCKNYIIYLSTNINSLTSSFP